MYKLLVNGQEINKYRTRQEANYYKKQYPHSKVVADYEITDIEKGLFADSYTVVAESPLKALQKYIEQYKLNIRIEVDLTNTGRFVVRSDNTSKVYNAVA